MKDFNYNATQQTPQNINQQTKSNAERIFNLQRTCSTVTNNYLKNLKLQNNQKEPKKYIYIYVINSNSDVTQSASKTCIAYRLDEKASKFLSIYSAINIRNYHHKCQNTKKSTS